MDNNSCNNCSALEKRRKAGWRNYFIMVEKYVELNSRYMDLVARINQEAQVVEEKNQFILPTHFLEELTENLKELECPVCLENMTKDTFNLTMCFHKVCKGCCEEIKNTTKKCPICRKKI